MEKEINKLVLEIIQITFPCYFIYSIMEVTSSAVREMGKALPSLVIMLLAQKNFQFPIYNVVILC